MKHTDPTWRLQTARIKYRGLKGEILTDSAGRSSAVGEYTYCFKTEGTTEKVRVQMYLDPAHGWQPVGGLAAVQAQAIAQLAIHIGEKQRKGGKSRGQIRHQEAEALYAAIRKWWKHYVLTNPRGPNPQSTADMRAATHFAVSEKTIKRATKKERQQSTKEIKEIPL